MPVHSVLVSTGGNEDGVNPYLLETITPYIVRLKEITEKEMPKGPAFLWEFVVVSTNKRLDGETAKGATINSFTTVKVFPGSKLWNWLEDMGVDLKSVAFNDDDTSVYTDLINSLIGETFVISVNHINKDVVKDGTTYKNTYNQIASIKKYVAKEKTA